LKNLKSTVADALSDYKLTQSEVNAIARQTSNALRQSAVFTSEEIQQLRDGLNYFKDKSVEEINAGLSYAKALGIDVVNIATTNINATLRRLR
jgi:hypothetical protein